MYIVYLVVLIGGHFINRRIKDRRALLQAAETEAAAKTHGSITALLNDVDGSVVDENYAEPDVTFAMTLRHAFLPRDDVPMSEKNIPNKIFSILKVTYI